MSNDNTIPPMQTGSQAQESQRLIEKIQETGVIKAQDAAQIAPARDENMTEDDEPMTIPMPVITHN